MQTTQQLADFLVNRFEKMTSGLYIVKLVLMILYELACRGVLFEGKHFDLLLKKSLQIEQEFSVLEDTYVYIKTIH